MTSRNGSIPLTEYCRVVLGQRRGARRLEDILGLPGLGVLIPVGAVLSLTAARVAGLTVVPEPNGHDLIVGPWASRVAMRAHHRKIRFSPWRYLDLRSRADFRRSWRPSAIPARSLLAVVYASSRDVQREDRIQANRKRLKRIEKPSMSSSGMKTALMTIAAQVQAVYGRNRVNVPQEVAR
jgi:hypothetical protein